MILKLAWRNIWRSKRRTAITLAMIIFAVVLSTLMMSIKEGMYANMIKSTAGDFSGYAQIHLNGYWSEKTLDYAFEVNDSVIKVLGEDKNIKGYLPRVEGFALAAMDNITKGSAVFGVDVEKEKEFTKLHERVVEGKYLSPDDDAIIIGKGLTEHLKIGVGDTLVLIGAGYQGRSAIGKYPIQGIVKFGSPELSNRLVFMPMKAANTFYATDGLVTSIIIKTRNGQKGVSAAKKLQKKLGADYEAMNWKELNPELVKMIDTDRVEGYVFMFILYLVISFGIFGTMLMMLAERRHEFGVLVAIGMKRAKLALMVWGEVLMLSILGSILGLICAFPVCYTFYVRPFRYGDEMAKVAEEYGIEAVIKTSLDPNIFIQQAIIVGVIASIIAIYPYIKLLSINAVTEMRS
ncbi:MAG: putative ABC transport system permease protein [Bacteroidia bacterium]|jgi:putative ABC transport system permease protein